MKICISFIAISPQCVPRFNRRPRHHIGFLILSEAPAAWYCKIDRDVAPRANSVRSSGQNPAPHIPRCVGLWAFGPIRLPSHYAEDNGNVPLRTDEPTFALDFEPMTRPPWVPSAEGRFGLHHNRQVHPIGYDCITLTARSASGFRCSQGKSIGH